MQLTLFDSFDRIEDNYEDDTIFLNALNWRAKFQVDSTSPNFKVVLLYCSTKKQLAQLREELAASGWSELPEGSIYFYHVQFEKKNKKIRVFMVTG